MTTLYLTEQYSTLRKDGDTLVVNIPANKEQGTDRRKVLRVAAVSAAIGVGLFLAGTHYVRAYLATGTVMGDIAKERAIAGTALEEAAATALKSRLCDAWSLVARVAAVAEGRFLRRLAAAEEHLAILGGIKAHR